MNRRQFLTRGLAAAGIYLLAGGHTPFNQWVVYRKKHLLIGCHRKDPLTYDLAKLLVAQLEEHLPAAKARVARAPTAGRLASLLGTDQLEIAVLAAADARDMAVGRGDFAPYGPVPLRVLAPVSGKVMIAHADFPPRHAWLVSDAILGGDPAKAAPGLPEFDLPWHEGTGSWIAGEPVPEP